MMPHTRRRNSPRRPALRDRNRAWDRARAGTATLTEGSDLLPLFRRENLRGFQTIGRHLVLHLIPEGRISFWAAMIFA